jgi:hypothetical protein
VEAPWWQQAPHTGDPPPQQGPCGSHLCCEQSLEKRFEASALRTAGGYNTAGGAEHTHTRSLSDTEAAAPCRDTAVLRDAPERAAWGLDTARLGALGARAWRGPWRCPRPSEAPRPSLQAGSTSSRVSRSTEAEAP